MTLFQIVLGLLGISILVFVHELGHFAAAKWAGVRVKTFALGFDPTIKGFRLRFAAWRWGDTEYVIGMVLFGGYVRLLGDTPEEKRGAPDEFYSQPAFRRAVIFAAGAAVNIVFGMAAFLLAFAVGVSFRAPEVGSVAPGSPAWQAGIMPGDRLMAIDGRSVESFDDVAIAAVLGGRTERLLAFERDGTPREVRLTPRIDSQLGMPVLGIGHAASRVIAGVRAGSAAERAGLKADEELVAATFRPGSDRLRIASDALPDGPFLRSFASYAFQFPGEPFLLTVKGANGSVRHIETTSIDDDSGAATPRLGVRRSARTVLHVHPESPAARLFRPGDLIASVNGESLHAVTVPDIACRVSPGETLSLRLHDGRTVTVERDSLFNWLWREDLLIGPEATVVGALAPQGRAAAAGLLPGDRVIAVGGSPVGDPDTVLERLAGGAHTLGVWRDGQPVTVTLSAGNELGITWHDTLVVGATEPGSPADEAGLTPGDVLVSLGGKPLDSWLALVETVGVAADKPLELTARRNGEEFTVTVTPRPWRAGSFGITFQEARTIVREGNVASAAALGVKRTIVSIKQIFVTILRLFGGEVATRNLQGPLGIIHVTGMVTRYGFGTMVYFLALISVNLGVLNLLPIPIFDGGHLLLLAIEKIKGSPVQERLVNAVTTVVFFLLIALALYVTYHDILRLML